MIISWKLRLCFDKVKLPDLAYRYKNEYIVIVVVVVVVFSP